MEERRSWLPPGLESSGWEPDDRASQRRGAAAKRSGDAGGRGNAASAGAAAPKAESSSNAGPQAAASPWQPYDPDRPESKSSTRSGGGSDPEPADTGGDDQSRRKPEPESQTEKGAEPGDKRDQPDGERKEPEAKAAEDGDREEQQGGRSDVDAMGQDKHRTVIGQRYGASRAKQFLYYGAFVAFVVAAYLGLQIAVDHLDKAPAHDKDQAPWSKPGAPNEPLGGFTPKSQGQKGPTNFQ